MSSHRTRSRFFIGIIGILALTLLGGSILPLLQPIVAHAQPAQSQEALNMFTSSGQKVTTLSNGRTEHFAASGDYTLEATEIVGTDAHLSLLPDPGHPTLTFSASTITGFSLSHPFEGAQLVLSSTGTVTATGVVIKTGIFSDIGTGLKSFAHKTDLLVPAAGGTVHHLVMKNVTLDVDRFIDADSFTVTGFNLAIAATAPAPLPATPPDGNTTPTPTKTPLPVPGKTPVPPGTPGQPQVTPTLTPPSVPIPIPTLIPPLGPTPTPTLTPTPTPKNCPCLLICLCPPGL